MAQTVEFSTGQLMRQRIYLPLLVALAVTSCQKKASGQTVAVVNNEEITSAELNAELASDPNGAVGDPKQVKNLALQRLIDRKLLVEQAKTDGLDKSPEYLNQIRRATDELLINLLVSKKMNANQLPTADEISRFEASHPEIFASREVWTLSQLVYPLPKDQAIIAKLSAAKSLDEIAQVLTASGIQFQRGTRKLDTAVFPHNIYEQIAKLKPGEPFIAPGPDKAVANVIAAREPAATPPDQARPIALNAMKREQMGQMVQDRVKNLRTAAKIQYQPGYGAPAK